MIPSDIEFGRVLTRLTFLGLVMNVMIPIGVFGAVVVFTGYDMHSGTGLKIPEEHFLKTIFFAFLAVSAADFGVTYLIRLNMPKRLMLTGGGESRTFEQAAVTLSVIIFSLNLSYTVYGLVLILLGGDIEMMMLFTALSLVAYQMFRPRQKFLERFRELGGGQSSE